jgi:alpha-N-arabinofuranosidase
MLWAQDLGMEPVLGIWAGFWLDGSHVNETELQPYVDDALDELEFLMGNSSTPWGAKRAALGYPEPWPIRFVEIGNEDSLNNGTETYRQFRFAAFYEAIKAKYPDMTVIVSNITLHWVITLFTH